MSDIRKIINDKLFFSIKAMGASMLPFFHSDDVLYIKKNSFRKVKINDILLFQNKNQQIVHRVIYKSRHYLITKGDNNPLSDGKIYLRQIIGKVVKIKRNGKVFDPNYIYLLQSSQYFQEIVKIKQAFEKAKIDFVFLKGLPLHLYFEGSHPHRIYADCDVLIDNKQVIHAERILSRYGYELSNQSLSKINTILRQKIIEKTFIKIINNFYVVFDVHLEIDWMSPQLGLLEELYPQELINYLTIECLQTKKQIKVNNEKFSILNPQFSIIYLALHLFHHNFSGAFRYEFLDKVIRFWSRFVPQNDGLFYDIARKIKEYRLQNFVYPVFILLKKYYKTPFPKSFLKSIQPNFMYGSVATDPYIRNLSIFDDEPRIQAGITRFKYLYYLSPNPWWRKVWVFVNPQVVYTVGWVIMGRIRRVFFSFLSRK